jgi:hypothetical protein
LDKIEETRNTPKKGEKCMKYLVSLFSVFALSLVLTGTPVFANEDADVSHCWTQEDVGPGTSSVLGGVTVTNTSGARSATISNKYCNGCQTHDPHSEVKFRDGASGSVTGLDGGDSVSIKGGNTATLNGNGFTASVTGNSNTVTVNGSNTTISKSGNNSNVTVNGSDNTMNLGSGTGNNLTATPNATNHLYHPAPGGIPVGNTIYGWVVHS